MGCQADERAIELIASPRPKRVGQSRPTVAVEPSVFDCAGDGRRALGPWRRATVSSRSAPRSGRSIRSACRAGRLHGQVMIRVLLERLSDIRLAGEPSGSARFRSGCPSISRSSGGGSVSEFRISIGARHHAASRNDLRARPRFWWSSAITTYGTQASRICLIVEGPAP